MVRINVDSVLQNELIDVLLQEVPIAQTPEGRDSLLEGIPHHKSWTRERNNHRIDLTQIISNLKATFVGEETSQCWGLTIFIDNAYATVKEVTAGRKLQEIRAQCFQYLEKEMTPPRASPIPRNSPGDDLAPLLSFPSPCSESETENTRTSEASSHEVSPSNDAFTAFFEATTSYIQTAQDGIDTASKPFALLFLGSAEPTRCRTAIRLLSASIHQLAEFCQFLERNSPLPEHIMTSRHLFTSHIHYLTEQIQTLINWIDESNGSHQGITEKFSAIQRSFTYFNSLQERRPGH